MVSAVGGLDPVTADEHARGALDECRSGGKQVWERHDETSSCSCGEVFRNGCASYVDWEARAGLAGLAGYGPKVKRGSMRRKLRRSETPVTHGEVQKIAACDPLILILCLSQVETVVAKLNVERRRHDWQNTGFYRQVIDSKKYS